MTCLPISVIRFSLMQITSKCCSHNHNQTAFSPTFIHLVWELNQQVYPIKCSCPTIGTSLKFLRFVSAAGANHRIRPITSFRDLEVSRYTVLQQGDYCSCFTFSEISALFCTSKYCAKKHSHPAYAMEADTSTSLLKGPTTFSTINKKIPSSAVWGKASPSQLLRARTQTPPTWH